MSAVPLDPAWARAVVVDYGAWGLKCGFAGDALPSFTLPPVCAANVAPNPYATSLAPTRLVGDEALDRAAPPAWVFADPLAAADVETLTRHAYKARLGVDPESRPLLLTASRPPGACTARQIAEFALDELRVCAVRCAHPAALAAVASARALRELPAACRVYAGGGPQAPRPPAGVARVACSVPEPPAQPCAACAAPPTALVVDVGEAEARAAAVVRGRVHEVPEARAAGSREITLAVGQAAGLAHAPAAWDVCGGGSARFRTPKDARAAARAKEELCYVCADAALEGDGLPELGGGPRLGRVRYTAPEVLFRAGPPRGRSLQEACAAALSAVQSAEDREELASNVVVCGGASLLPGLPKRLARELWAVGVCAGVVQVPGRECLAWTGGAIVSSPGNEAADAGPGWLTREEWDECGSSALNELIPQSTQK
eukprot:m51a1_g14047 putative actin-like protein 2 (430) ;mRNA; r:1185432-1186721